MAIAAGQKIRASYFNVAPASSADTSVTDGTTGSAYPTFTNTLTTTGMLGVAFVAPPSGRVIVSFMTGEARTNTTAKALLSFEIKTGSTVGSGTLVYASDNATAQSAESDTANKNRALSGETLVSGLTGGTTYNATLTYSVTGGTGTYNRRSIIVDPKL